MKKNEAGSSLFCLCVSHRAGDEWYFEPHLSAVGKVTDQDLLLKFTMPTRVRRIVLQRLGRSNLNAFSLYGSEEASMRSRAMVADSLARIRRGSNAGSLSGIGKRPGSVRRSETLPIANSSLMSRCILTQRATRSEHSLQFLMVRA